MLSLNTHCVLQPRVTACVKGRKNADVQISSVRLLPVGCTQSDRREEGADRAEMSCAL